MRLSSTELADLAEAAGRRAIIAWEREQRAKTNEVVKVRTLELERDDLAERLDKTSTALGHFDRGRKWLVRALASLLLAFVSLLVERLTTGRVDVKAHEAAEAVVEERAAPIEQRAEAAAVSATTTDARQTAAEARELEREVRLERLIVAIERQAAAVEAAKKRGAR